MTLVFSDIHGNLPAFETMLKQVGRVDRFRLMGASEGSSVAQLWGRMRVGGQVIWATEFQENKRSSGGKGAPQPKTTQYSYSVSVAVALCEGEITTPSASVSA